MPEISEVEVGAVDPERFDSVLSGEQVKALDGAIADARKLFEGRTIWNVNSTAHGGGVAEMLNTLLPYARGVGVDTRWLVIAGDEQFFVITKRIHNRLHGAPGDGQGLGDDDRKHYEYVLEDQAEQLKRRFRPGDVVILHDPQTAGLIPSRSTPGSAWSGAATWAWTHPTRMHATPGTSCFPTCVAPPAASSRERRSPGRGSTKDRIIVVMPSIDPFSTKNIDIDPATVHADPHGRGHRRRRGRRWGHLQTRRRESWAYRAQGDHRASRPGWELRRPWCCRCRAGTGSRTRSGCSRDSSAASSPPVTRT